MPTSAVLRLPNQTDLTKLNLRKLHEKKITVVFYSPPAKANRVRSPAGIVPEFSHVGIVADDAAGRRALSGISHLCFLALLHTHIASPASAPETSLFRAAQISSLYSPMAELSIAARMQTRVAGLVEGSASACTENLIVAYRHDILMQLSIKLVVVTFDIDKASEAVLLTDSQRTGTVPTVAQASCQLFTGEATHSIIVSKPVREYLSAAKAGPRSRVFQRQPPANEMERRRTYCRSRDVNPPSATDKLISVQRII
ncbi:hypothetical protein PR048_003707 [Dryococelus australis]|uniref:Uncharacterized protein n=1 Tax=Dryococelus australis TaxID=614101 RepID=A0ABQ9INT5_9NEOP|nr:hypothetical protein PR048_003707 [Dryococelus australis]